MSNWNSLNLFEEYCTDSPNGSWSTYFRADGVYRVQNTSN